MAVGCRGTVGSWCVVSAMFVLLLLFNLGLLLTKLGRIAESVTGESFHFSLLFFVFFVFVLN